MKTRIYGNDKKRITNSELKLALEYYMNMLFKDKPEKLDFIEINVRLTDLNGDYDGLVLNVDECNEEFEIELDKSLGKRKLLVALAHECVHIKQFIKGELVCYGTNAIKWKRKIYTYDEATYWDLPSEIEAHGKELGLYVRFRTYKNKFNIKFAT